MLRVTRHLSCYYCCTTVHGVFFGRCERCTLSAEPPGALLCGAVEALGFQKAPVVLTHGIALGPTLPPSLGTIPSLLGRVALCMLCFVFVCVCVCRDSVADCGSVKGETCHPWLLVGGWWPVCFYKVQDYCVIVHASLSALCAPHSSRLPANNVCATHTRSVCVCVCV